MLFRSPWREAGDAGLGRRVRRGDRGGVGEERPVVEDDVADAPRAQPELVLAVGYPRIPGVPVAVQI